VLFLIRQRLSGFHILCVNFGICVEKLRYSGVFILHWKGCVALRQVYSAMWNLGTDSLITMLGKYKKKKKIHRIDRSQKLPCAEDFRQQS